MNEKFERIRPDPHIGNAQPTIRDTQISVSEIVSQIADGKPVQAVLAEYPSLELEDIHQALAFAVRDLTVNIFALRSDGLNPINIIQGCSRLLLDEQIELNEEEKRELAKALHKSTAALKTCWNNLSQWENLIYYNVSRKDEGRHTAFSSIMEQVLRNVSQDEPSAVVKVSEPDDLPSIKGDSVWVVGAITNLLVGEAQNLKPGSLITVKQAEDLLLIQIYREFKYKPSDPQDPLHWFYWGSSPLSTAAVTIRRLGGEIHIQLSDDGLTFEVKLPVWKPE